MKDFDAMVKLAEGTRVRFLQREDYNRTIIEKAYEFDISMGIAQAEQKYNIGEIYEVGEYFECEPDGNFCILREMRLELFEPLRVRFISEKYLNDRKTRDAKFSKMCGIKTIELQPTAF